MSAMNMGGNSGYVPHVQLSLRGGQISDDAFLF